MKENLIFRGLKKDRKKNNKGYYEWYKGSYWKTDDTTYAFKNDYDLHPNNTHHYILYDEMMDWGLPNRKIQVEIDEETLSQYTYRVDKNNKRIFEYDIIKGDSGLIGFVEFDEYLLTFVVRTKLKSYTLYDMPKENIEIIGDIYNNRDLLQI